MSVQQPSVHKHAIPAVVTSTKTETSSTEVTTVSVTSTTTTEEVSATATASATVSTVVPWCSNNAVLRADGCAQSEWTTYCGASVEPIGINRQVFSAHQLSFEDCLGVCDSNGFCTSGTYFSDTGACELYLYAGAGAVNLVPTAGAVQAFEFIYGTLLNGGCPSYECPSSGVAQCCGGTGCADMTPPYDA